MMQSLRLEDDVRSEVGCVRQSNEDSTAAIRAAQLWVVADGMGGHQDGKLASTTIIAAIEAVQLPDDLSGACEMLGDAIHDANRTIYDIAQASQGKMGSTVVTLLIRDRRFAVLWAGDSRAYVFRDQELYQLTRDHTQVQEMVDRGLLTPEEALGHPMGHVLARAVGVQPTLEIDAIIDDVVSEDIFLLCSDGLHGLLSGEEIAAIIAHSGSASAGPLVAACEARGAPDNISVIVIKACEPTAVVLARKASA